MIVQTDSKWMTYALIGALVLGALIYDKVNSVVGSQARPIMQVAPAQFTAEPVVLSIPDAPTPKPASPNVAAHLPTATAPAAPTPLPQYITHVVRPGDTLYSIARRYNVSIEAIMTKNQLTNYTIYVGQQLTIPR